MLFKQELGEDFDPSNFIRELEITKSFFQSLNCHEGLLGILLGYGVESSMQYHRRNLMWKSTLPIPYEEIHLKGIPTHSSYLDFADPICFVGDPLSEDVKIILEKNEKERADLQKIYSRGNFLKITLQRLMETSR